MDLQFYVNVVLAALGTGWGLLWFFRAIATIKNKATWSFESRIRDIVNQSRDAKADRVEAELQRLEAYLGIRSVYNKELGVQWFEPLPTKPTYRNS